MKRRCFLRSLVLLTLAGCGSDSLPVSQSGEGAFVGENGTPGQVNLAEIGGRSWSVRTATFDIPVSQAGKVTLPTPRATQLFLLLDHSKAVRAMTVAFVDESGPVVFDAARTALALAFCTPGLAGVEPKVAGELRDQLRELPSYAVLSQLMRIQLPLISVESSLMESAVSDALFQLVSDWSSIYGSPPPSDSLLSAEFDGAGGVRLRNGATRFLTVRRQDFDAGGQLLTEAEVGLLQPPPVEDWSQLFQTGRQPSELLDTSLNLTQRPEVRRVVYIFRGPADPLGADFPTVPVDYADMLSGLLVMLPIGALLAGQSGATSYDDLLDAISSEQAEVMLAELRRTPIRRKSGIAKTFGWAVAGASLVTGALLVKEGKTELGIALILSGVISMLNSSEEFAPFLAYLVRILHHWRSLPAEHSIELTVA